LSVLRRDPDRFRREVRVREEGVRKRLSRVIALASALVLFAGLCLALYLVLAGWKP
jgi:putative copper export protein